MIKKKENQSPRVRTRFSEQNGSTIFHLSHYNLLNTTEGCKSRLSKGMKREARRSYEEGGESSGEREESCSNEEQENRGISWENCGGMERYQTTDQMSYVFAIGGGEKERSHRLENVYYFPVCPLFLTERIYPG